MITKEVTGLIKVKLLERGLTQKEFGEKMGLSKQYINDIIKGRIDSVYHEYEILKELELLDDTGAIIR